MIDVDRLADAFREHAERLLAEFGGEVITSCDPDPPSGRFFVAEAKAETSLGEIRMIFGDREFEVRTSVKPAGRPWPLGLAFYLRAMQQDDCGVLDSMWVHNDDRLVRVLARHAEALRICLPKLNEDAFHWWSRAEEERLGAIKAGKDLMLREEMKAAVSRAAEAFRAGDFDRVVSLLVPYSDILSEAQRRKLEFARMRSEADHD